MTGQKNRYTTTEKLWDLDDKTLKTPAHDEMVLWLLNKDNIKSLFPEYYNLLIWSKINKNSLFYNLINNDLWRLYNSNQQIGPAEISEIIKEVKFTKYEVGNCIFGYEFDTFYKKYDINLNKYLKNEDKSKIKGTVNLTDEMMKNIIQIEKENIVNKLHSVWNDILTERDNGLQHLNNTDIELLIKSEVPITATNGFLVGYTDIEINFNINTFQQDNIQMWHDNQEQNISFPVRIFIEVKPTIKSFGETLRQLNTYKHYLHTDEIYLFTADLRFKEAFESQGIKVLTYPD